jgi:hypothetical protein
MGKGGIIEYGPLLVEGWINGMHLDVRAFGPPPLKRSHWLRST